MSYLKDFRQRIRNNDYPGFLKLWEEYCYGDQPDGEELVLILQEIKAVDMSKSFGSQVARVLPLWRLIQNKDTAAEVLRLIFDIQTTQSEELAELAIQWLQEHSPDDPLFADKMRLVGLRNREQFQGCIRNFELLSHLKKGNFLFHTAGWGTAEIIDVSFIREEITLECEYVMGTKYFSFSQAFRTLRVLPKDHFYARRFGDADALEQEARKDPASVIRLMLRDLGPKTAWEIKEEMSDLVIPEDDWARWWQTARTKIKKDTKIESPKTLREPFELRKEARSHESTLHEALKNNVGVSSAIQMIYTFLRDFPETLKNADFRASLILRLEEFRSQALEEAQRLQILFFLEDLGQTHVTQEINTLVANLRDVIHVVMNIETLPFQKRVLQLVKAHRSDWSTFFLDLLLLTDANALRDYLLQELQAFELRDALTAKLGELLIHPTSHPEALIWYFRKLFQAEPPEVYGDAAGQNRFFEQFLVLLAYLDQAVAHRDLAKRALSLILSDRYKIVRHVMQQSSLEEVREYLLLSTKCSLFSDHDIKILHSLAEVVYPALARYRKSQDKVEETVTYLWTTQEGYLRTQQRIQHIATVETVQNAKEIEAARALGDLRENAEFKAALERRDRLQSELKFLSDQLNQARILTPEDVSLDVVGVGAVVHCENDKGEHVKFVLLGPWEADPERHILSYQSKLAQAMEGKKAGETFSFQNNHFTITDIHNYFKTKL